MFKDFGIRPISKWVEEFEINLFPWGGIFRFKKYSEWYDGPVNILNYK
jgi:hypothetical protein